MKGEKFVWHGGRINPQLLEKILPRSKNRVITHESVKVRQVASKTKQHEAGLGLRGILS